MERLSQRWYCDLYFSAAGLNDPPTFVVWQPSAASGQSDLDRAALRLTQRPSQGQATGGLRHQAGGATEAP